MEIVQHHQHRLAAIAGEARQHVERVDLVGEIEMRRRFVEQQQIGILREQCSERDATPLAARKRAHFTRLESGKADVGDGFSGFTVAFLHLFLAGLVSSLLISLGFLVCIIPGIYLVVAWAFALPLVADKQLDFWPAMELSRRVVTLHWWELFALLLVNFLLMTAGFFACIVGSFITFPIAVGAVVYAYEDIFGARPTTAA